MATNILNQIYKEAKTTSKGVIQMNRTLNLIYEDQEKGNKRQEKFLADLKNRQRREEREEKRRQSDLKKMIAGKAVTAKKAEKDDIGGDGKGILGAITDGLGQVFGLLKDLLIAAIIKRLTGFFRLPGNPFRPRGGGGTRPNKPTKPKPKPNKPTKPGGTKPGTRPGARPNAPVRPVKPGGVKPPATSLPPVKIPKPGAKPPATAIKPGSILRPGSIAAGVKTLGVSLALDYLAGLAVNAVDQKILEMKLQKYIEASDEDKKKMKETATKIVADNKAYIEGGGILYWTEKTAAMGGEINAEHEYRMYTHMLGMIEQYEYDEDMKDYVGQLEAQQLQKGGGVFDVPGHGQGDQVPMMLPPGAFVLNRVAAQEMFARGGSPSGMVPTLLEPGEKVFMPGDPLMDMAMSFNSSFSRFQKGGQVGQPSSDTASEKITDRGLNQLSGKGGSQAVVSVGQMLLDEGFTVKEHPNFAGRSFNKEGTARVGGHSQNSLHYKNLAIDVTDWREGAWQQRTATLAEKMYRQRKELNLTQIIHDPWGAWFAGEGQKGPGIGGHETHLHLGFASGPASDKGYVGKGDANTPGNNEKQKEKDGLFGAIGSAIGSVFSPITDAITGAMESGPFAQLTKQMTGAMSDMMSELQSPQAQEDIEKIKSAISNQVKSMNLTGKSPSDDHMKKIRQAMDPDTEETVVQVVPSQEKQVEPTISGQTNNNVPTGLTTRCSSWASADYRYDRSLNCETL